MRRLAALLVVCAACSWAAPESQGVPKPTPTVEGQAANSSDRAKDEAANALLVRTVESQDEAVHTKERETKSDQHDREDLEAQIRTADASEEQVLVGFASLALTAIGTVLLILTFFYSLRSSKAAVKISTDTATAYQTAERAWVGVDTIDKLYNFDGSGKNLHEVRFVPRIKNSGGTPAFKCNIFVDGKVEKPTAKAPLFQRSEPPAERSGMCLPGGSMRGLHFRLNADEIKDVSDRELRAFMYIRIDYEDIFNQGINRCTEMCAEVVCTAFRLDDNDVEVPVFELTATGPQNTAT